MNAAGGEAGMASGRAPRLLFASYHCALDPSSGAAISMRDLLELLAGRGWRSRVFCGPLLDFDCPESLPGLLKDQGLPFERRDCGEGETSFSLYHYSRGSVSGTIYAPARTSAGGPTPREIAPFLALYRRVLERQRPDVLLTYGGQWFSREMMDLARRRGVAVVFALRNFAYRDPRLFEPARAVLVPSRFCADWYGERLGLQCTAIPSPIDWTRARCEPAGGRRYVTFVNPQPSKGVFVLARIALELGRRRSDIPLLVVEGRGQALSWLERSGLDLSRLENLNRMANTPDPRDFYRVSRLVLMPSLWNESFGRVAAEAMLGGVPVLASTRGALPEVVGEAGLLFDIPARYTPATRQAPTAEEVAPWVDAIIRLWDNDALYDQQRRKCLAAAEAWRPEPIAKRHDAFFRELINETAGPIFF